MKKNLFILFCLFLFGVIGYTALKRENVASASATPENLTVVNSPAPESVEDEVPDVGVSKDDERSGEENEEGLWSNVQYLTGRIEYSKHPEHFVKVDAQHCSQSTYLQKEAYEAFKKMYNAAKKDGVDLKIISGARNFDSQKGIWERKWEANADKDSMARAKYILLYSSIYVSSIGMQKFNKIFIFIISRRHQSNLKFPIPIHISQRR